MVVVVTNNAALALNSAKKIRKVKRNLSMDMESDEDGEVADTEQADAHPKIPGQKTPQVTNNKAKVAGIGARRGYESENEAKSLNSTTTSSTFPNLKQGGHNNVNTPKNPRKMSTRSLSHIPKSNLNRKDGESKEKDLMTITPDDIANHYSDKYAPTKIKIV